MSEPFLILHKVRGEPAFDIAEKLSCPECTSTGCDECAHEGFWWIIPTSGHRAYPYWHTEVQMKEKCVWLSNQFVTTDWVVPPMPTSLPDHYPSRLAPSTPSIDLISALNIKPSCPLDFKRRV